MSKLWNKIRRALGWRVSHQSGPNRYYYNRVTGKRRVTKMPNSGYQPADERWLNSKDTRT